jgi:hypothetical protein
MIQAILVRLQLQHSQQQLLPRAYRQQEPVHTKQKMMMTSCCAWQTALLKQNNHLLRLLLLVRELWY